MAMERRQWQPDTRNCDHDHHEQSIATVINAIQMMISFEIISRRLCPLSDSYAAAYDSPQRFIALVR